jgi:hypothetical protein
MILFKEITAQNCLKFIGLPANIMVADHKQRDFITKNKFFLIGIVVCQVDEREGRYFYIQFSNGDSSGIYDSVFELIEKEERIFSFYYIEIKKQS